MPWKSIMLGDTHIADIAKKFKVAAIPRLIILKMDGTVIEEGSVGAVEVTGPPAFEDWLKK